MIKELRTLWDVGVDAVDVSAPPKKKHLNLKAMLLWPMHDFLEYGVCSSLQTQGHNACPPCGPHQLESRSLNALQKVIYMGHRKYLPYNHKLCHPHHDRAFGKKRAGMLPVRTTTKYWWKRWKLVKSKEIPKKDAGVKARSIFYKLPYYKVSF